MGKASILYPYHDIRLAIVCDLGYCTAVIWHLSARRQLPTCLDLVFIRARTIASTCKTLSTTDIETRHFVQSGLGSCLADLFVSLRLCCIDGQVGGE